MIGKPFISVIVPNYNYARYLNLRMESILNQTYQNFEVIILDDNSTDNSFEIIDKYRFHPKVSKIIVNELNSGSPFKQWERGIKEASGNIIWIAESDDLCSNMFLEIMVHSYVKSNAVLCFCRSELIDENGNYLRKNSQMSSVDNDLTLTGDSFIKQYLGYRNEVQNASSAIFDKQTAMSIPKEYMSFRGAGDWLFWIEIARRGNVAFCNKILNQYRLHNNTTRNVVISGIEFHETKRIYEWLHSSGYLSDSAIKRCRKETLLLIDSIDYIPEKVKQELYDMWGVASYIRLYLTFIKALHFVKRMLLTIFKKSV